MPGDPAAHARHLEPLDHQRSRAPADSRRPRENESAIGVERRAQRLEIDAGAPFLRNDRAGPRELDFPMASREILDAQARACGRDARAECADLTAIDFEDVRGQAGVSPICAPAGALALLDAALHADEAAQRRRARAQRDRAGLHLRLELDRGAQNRSRREVDARRTGRPARLAADVDAGKLEARPLERRLGPRGADLPLVDHEAVRFDASGPGGSLRPGRPRQPSADPRASFRAAELLPDRGESPHVGEPAVELEVERRALIVHDDRPLRINLAPGRRRAGALDAQLASAKLERRVQAGEREIPGRDVVRGERRRGLRPVETCPLDRPPRFDAAFDSAQLGNEALQDRGPREGEVERRLPDLARLEVERARGLQRCHPEPWHRGA